MRDAGFEPLEPYPGAAGKWRCRCLTCGKASTPRLDTVGRGSGCRHCAGMAPLEPAEAVAAIRAAGFEPLEEYPGRRSKPWRCRCTTCGKESRPNLKRVLKGSGCRHCASSAPRPPEDAVAMMRAAGLEPLEPYRNVDVPWRARCTVCGNEVAPRLNSIRAGRGCLFCGQARTGMKRRTDATEAEAVMREAGLEPLEAYPGSSKPWRSRCMVCGHEVTPTLTNVRKGHGCGYCANVAVDPDDAAGVMCEADLEPLEPYPGGQTGWRCRCLRCGAEVRPQYANVRIGRGCIACARFGFQPDMPAVVYLVTDPVRGAHKIGKTGVESSRLGVHQTRGWQVYKVLRVERGEQAGAIEQAILRWWRNDLGLPPYLADEDGWTETIDADAVSLVDVWRRVLAESRSLGAHDQLRR